MNARGQPSTPGSPGSLPIRRRRAACRLGFTMLEVMLAVAILGIVAVALYQFVDTTLRAAAFSEKSGREDAALSGLRRLVNAQLAALPANQNGALIGMSVQARSGRRDALQLVCPAGNALLTPDARGYYQITLDLRETPRGSGRYTLGLERQPWSDDDDDADDGDDKPAASPLHATDLRAGGAAARMPGDWIKLLDGVQQLEVGYFDARLNGWVDKWTDQSALPNLVRVRVSTAGRADPYEIVARVPGGGVQRVIPTTADGTVPNLLTGRINNGTVPAAPAVNPGSAPPSSFNNTVLPNGFAVPTPPNLGNIYPRPGAPR